MTEPKAWHCPNCNAYHAPHVETCPANSGLTTITSRTKRWDCGCAPGQYCTSSGCPRARNQVPAAISCLDILGDQRIGVSVGANFTGVQG